MAPPLPVGERRVVFRNINWHKPALYASIGVPEFWRYDGREWKIYQLEDREYLEVSISPTFSIVPKEMLYEFLAAARIDEVEAEMNLRNWVRKTRKF
jgi:hypothetical protein